MTSPYAGNPAVFPVDYVIPDDASPPTAADINPALEALGDRTAYLGAHSHRAVYTEFLANGTITFPATALPTVIIEACGGGGGGGGGCQVTAAGDFGSGGGGGGGAIQSTLMLVIIPGDLYDVTIGAGGAGGNGGVDNTGFPSPGNDGVDTTLVHHADSAVVGTWRGAGGGVAGQINDADGTWVKALGGMPSHTSLSPTMPSFDATTMPILEEINDWVGIVQHGASGLCHKFSGAVRARPGSASPQGFAGGAAGVSNTTNSGSYQGGGQGGGGGAGPYGAGGLGGDGGTPNNSGHGSGGTAGASGAANTGAGGGGGGGAGGEASPSVGIQYGGSGHGGGSGRMRVLYFVPAVS